MLAMVRDDKSPRSRATPCRRPPGLKAGAIRRRDPRALGFGTYRIVDSEIARRPYLRINYPGTDIDPAEREEAATVKLGSRLLHQYFEHRGTIGPHPRNRGNSQGRTHRETSSNYLCTNDE